MPSAGSRNRPNATPPVSYGYAVGRILRERKELEAQRARERGRGRD